ncbi:ATP-binding protein [Micromonospora sp. M12]
MVANGFAIEIEDRGLGMSGEDLAAANHRIVDRSELNLANAARLGLYVVSRLTERHGVRVRLKSPRTAAPPLSC